MESKELFLVLGAIKADLDNLKKVSEENAEKLDECVLATHTLKSIVDSISPEVMDYRKMKQRGWGIVATLGFFGTVFGAFLISHITDFFRRFYGS